MSDLLSGEAKPQRKSRSGSQRRKREGRVELRLLPAEKLHLESLASEGGYPSVQDFIRARLAPELAAVS